MKPIPINLTQQEIESGCICSPENVKSVCNVFVGNMHNLSLAIMASLIGLAVLGIIAIILFKIPKLSQYAKYAIDMMVLFGVILLGAAAILAYYVLI